MTDANRAARLTQALRDLDDNNEAHWTDGRAPRISAVQSLAGFTVTRAELDAAGRVRNVSHAGGTAPQPATDGDGTEPSESAEVASEAEAVENVAECQRQLDNARATFRATETRLRTARKALGASLIVFTQGSKINPSDVVRDNVARDIARKRAIATGEVKAPESQVPEFQSAVDAQAFFSKGGKAGGKYAAFRRGASATPGGRVKLPSQR